MPKDKDRTQKSESVSNVLTASDIELIVHKAMEAAMMVLRDEIGKLITEMQSRVSDIEDHLVNVESRMDTVSLTADINSDLAQELESVNGS